MKLINCGTAEELLKKIDIASDDWFDLDTKESHWIFRGQSSGGDGLLPSLYRVKNINQKLGLFKPSWFPQLDLNCFIENSVKSRIGNISHFKSSEIKRLVEIVKRNFLEFVLLEEFLYAANKAGLEVQTLRLFEEQSRGIDSTHYLHGEISRFLDEFCRPSSYGGGFYKGFV